MNMKTSNSLLWVFIITSLAVAATGNGSGQLKILDGGAMSLPTKETLQEPASLSEDPYSFPFTIEGSKFFLNEEEVFLNIIGYQPLEPGKKPWDENYPERERISDYRLKDDLRRFKAFQGGSEPNVLRIYTQPTPRVPNRLPKFFYDGVRKLGFWIIRDIYFDSIDINEGQEKVDMVFSEVNDANAFDLIFAWEIGNEFKAGKDGSAEAIESFIEGICAYIKEEVDEVGNENVSNWVTWQSWVGSDPFWTDYEYTIPIEPEGLDYISFNAYCYEPAQIRDHQAGPTTGTPYQGYLAALKDHYSDKPLVIVETGLSDSNLSEPDAEHVHERLRPWYPSYRKGALTGEQVGEGLADRYWDARLLSDDNDANMVIAGAAIFEWNDELWKAGGDWEPDVDNQMPEEHFGLARFVARSDEEGYQLRYKLQQETVRDLYTLKFDNDINIIDSVMVDDNTLPVDANTWVHAIISPTAVKPVRLRWETNRGYIIGNPNSIYDPNELGEPTSVKFYVGNVALGPATITVVAVDANGNVGRVSNSIDIEITEPNRIEILTAGGKLSSGRVHNVNLSDYKLICYLLEKWRDPNMLVAKPRPEMKSIWIRQDGYWWLPIVRNPEDDLYCWLVPKEYESSNLEEEGWSPTCAIAEANTMNMSPNEYKDDDDDLLPDWWEIKYFSSIDPNDRYDDFDGDMANNLEEFLAGSEPNVPNDNDNDGLWDNWERHYFGNISFFDANDDPDKDGLRNLKEMTLELHPVRVAADKDQDGLPDLWEIRRFNNLSQKGTDNPDFDGCANLDEYELGLDPLDRDLVGDLDCDCDVDLGDLRLFVQEWPGAISPANIAPDSPDRIVNFLDFTVFANAWRSIDIEQPSNWNPSCDIAPNGIINADDLAVFAEEWLFSYYADIAPSEGDGVVDLRDFAAFAKNWLKEL